MIRESPSYPRVSAFIRGFKSFLCFLSVLCGEQVAAWAGEIPAPAAAVSFEFNLNKPAATSGFGAYWK